MKITEKQKIIVAILIFALSGYIIYSTFFSSNTTGNATVSGSSSGIASSSAQQEGQDILDLSDKLKAMSIDSQIFNSVVFKSLIDFDVPLSPELQGRPNPFAAIGNDGGIQTIPTFPTTIASTTNKKKK